jgi:hypothetical protein
MKNSFPKIDIDSTRSSILTCQVIFGRQNLLDEFSQVSGKFNQSATEQGIVALRKTCSLAAVVYLSCTPF